MSGLEAFLPAILHSCLRILQSTSYLLFLFESIFTYVFSYNFIDFSYQELLIY